jgi:hypothetical protein
MSKLHLLLPVLLVSSLAACTGVDDMGGPNGERADELAEGADAGVEEEEVEVDDGFAAARDVNVAHVTFDEETLAPEFYSVPDQDTDMNLGGTEFWQRWPGGESPTFSYSVGTDFGRRCMYASAVRFSTIMADPPQEILDVLENTNWGGSFFNWNDDFSGGDRTATAPRLWAWRTHLIKWISQTDGDGSCHLPTLDMLVAAAEDCLETADANEGEIQGCSAR